MLFTLLVSWRGAQCVSTKSANTATNIHGGYPEVQGTCTPNCNQHFAHNVRIPHKPVVSEVLPAWALND